MTDTNKLTERITSVLEPRAALIAYATSNRHGSGYDEDYYVEARRIDSDGVMGEGCPVTMEFMTELVKSFSGVYESVPHGRIPFNLLWADTRKGIEKYVWYNVPQKRMMFFADKLGIENAEYNVPGVVYSTNRESLEIYAYKDIILSPESQLYAAPFFNVSRSSVCLGSAKLEKPKDLTYDNLIEYWEKIFWLSEFVHLGSNGNPTKNNLVLVTKAARNAPFDNDELVPLKNLKLKDILK